jgi:hypothetical protein
MGHCLPFPEMKCTIQRTFQAKKGGTKGNLLIVVVALEFFLLETGIGMAADPELLLC